jgi:hypothetical protein
VVHASRITSSGYTSYVACSGKLPYGIYSFETAEVKSNSVRDTVVNNGRRGLSLSDYAAY